MEVAYSIIENKNIHATDNSLGKTSNYWSLGLRCPECAEPVYWKSGSYSSKPHFAHFHATSFSEKCSLRSEKSSPSISGNLTNTDYSLLLKNIQSQLIKFIANSSIVENIIFSIDETIELNDAEQRVVNLIHYPPRSSIFSMYNDIYEKCKRENSLEVSNDPNSFIGMFYFMKNQDFFQRYLRVNRKIGLEIAVFLSRKSNSIILYNLVRIFVKRVLEDYPSQDPVLKTRTYILKSIAIKDWQSILP
ncbi:MAG: hypothetical protein VKI82_04530 [Leptolyngbya sp.]|nr:hypothetical protein [Leptolyngbya sp.]